jgi:hypothetical protein
MKKILINFFLISVLLACKQDSIETEISIKGASYLIDYIDIDNSLKFSDSQNYKYVTPKVMAILDYSIKNIKFDKNSTFNMTVEGSVNKNINGTYQFINGGKILILKYANSNKIITFDILETTSSKLNMSIEVNDNTYIPSNFKMLFYFKKI